MYYYIYKTTHVDSGKFYIGRRCSDIPPDEDPYLGSGKRLILAIKKYGRECFSKDILFIHETLEELVESEKQIVNKELLKDPLCYNLAEGGWGGYTDISNRHFKGSPESNKKISLSKLGKPRPDLVERHKTDTSFKHRWKGQRRTDDDKKKKSDALTKAYAEGRHKSYGEFICPHCGKVGKMKSNMLRWHFDNCKGKV